MTNNIRQKLADSFSEGTFQLSLLQLHRIHLVEPVACGIMPTSWLWPTTINRQTSNVTYSSSFAYQYTALLTLRNRNMPLMEPDAAYQGCLPSCELYTVDHSPLGVQAQAILRLRTHGLRISGFWECAAQSQDCANSQIARNIYISSHLHASLSVFKNCIIARRRSLGLKRCKV